ncbi:MAG: S8 family peptidase [Thermoanaerobaculia bacterium]|jgi:hypothetical protein
MPRQNNFLLGNGERLTHAVTVPSGGGDKNPPYDFPRAKKRVGERLRAARTVLDALPVDACPGGEVVAVLTMHPRYISKSDFPDQLLRSVGMRAVGSRSSTVVPEEWGVKKHKDSAVTQQIFVAGQRTAFDSWADKVSTWSEQHDGASELSHIEDITALTPEEKLRNIPDGRPEVMLEVVLHNDAPTDVLRSFAAFATKRGALPLVDRARTVQGLTFVPVRSTPDRVREVAEFSFLRVARGMPTLRPLAPTLFRSVAARKVVLPTGAPIGTAKAVIFDGGLPANHGLDRWVTLVEPSGIGPAVPDGQHHGFAVTSAALFGHLKGEAESPTCFIDHVRVCDNQTGSDLELFDVIDRITAHLNAHSQDYRYLNLSLGPRLAIDDHEVTVFTASLDDLLARLNMVAVVAVGNDGELDPSSGLNRLQPPSDGVNVLAVGACDTEAESWARATYSCVGPGRSPGYVKPDGMGFGGSPSDPFCVLSPFAPGEVVGIQGTSFAAPYVLRTIALADAALSQSLEPLTLRALAIHRADRNGHDQKDVGWGRFESDLGDLLTCEDQESIIVFQGFLPVGEHLRAPLPLPKGPLAGKIQLSATLLISPEVDPEHATAYTRSGLEVFFRPDSRNFKTYISGKQSAHPKTKAFFSKKNTYGASEADLRDDGLKWEPCRKQTRVMRAASLFDPCFDIYYHHREGTTAASNPQPIPYALVVGLTAPKMKDFYARVARTYANILIPLRPKIQIQVRAS